MRDTIHVQRTATIPPWPSTGLQRRQTAPMFTLRSAHGQPNGRSLGLSLDIIELSSNVLRNGHDLRVGMQG